MVYDDHKNMIFSLPLFFIRFSHIFSAYGFGVDARKLYGLRIFFLFFYSTYDILLKDNIYPFR